MYMFHMRAWVLLDVLLYLQTELKRIQKRNRAMEEELAGDLAEQCHGGLEEENSLQETAPEMFEHIDVAERLCHVTSPLSYRLFCLDRLIGLQGQLVVQSEEAKKRYK